MFLHILQVGLYRLIHQTARERKKEAIGKEFEDILHLGRPHRIRRQILPQGGAVDQGQNRLGDEHE